MNDGGSFVNIEDSLNITYTFRDANTVVIELENTSNRLVYADWSRSSIVFNGESIPFKDEISKLNGTANTTQIVKGSTSIDFEGTISESSTRTYIPPESKVSRAFSKLPIAYTKNLRKSHPFEPILLPSTAKKYSFSEKNSLNNIRSYILVVSDDDSSVLEIKHQFWMATIVETMDGKLRSKGNQLKESKLTATGVVLASVVTVIALGLEATEDE